MILTNSNLMLKKWTIMLHHRVWEQNLLLRKVHLLYAIYHIIIWALDKTPMWRKSNIHLPGLADSSYTRARCILICNPTQKEGKKIQFRYHQEIMRHGYCNEGHIVQEHVYNSHHDLWMCLWVFSCESGWLGLLHAGDWNPGQALGSLLVRLRQTFLSFFNYYYY